MSRSVFHGKAMQNYMDNKEHIYSVETEYLYKGDRVEGMDLKPEVIPCFLTTAFNMDNLHDVNDVYARHGYTYIRTRNPNRDALASVISYLENGKASDIFSSGMGAITSTLFTLLAPGDHMICNKDIYGETFNVMDEFLMQRMNVDVTEISFADMDAVRKAITPKTKVIYTEVVSNPTFRIADIASLAAVAHEAGAKLVVDNTFTTPFAVKPLDLGADVVINSLTKFLNGHSDAIGGSVTSNDAELVAKIHHISMLTGTPGDPFSSWLILRGVHTAAIRIPRQIETAAKLAHALEKNPLVLGVNHPSLESHPQHALAQSMVPGGLGSPILSVYLPEDVDKISAFMDRLQFAKYAPTLGGIRTSLSHPVTSSHPNVPDDIRRAMGITPGLIRVSVGTENANDLIADFEQALEVFKN